MNRHLDELCYRVADEFRIEAIDILTRDVRTPTPTAARRVAMWLVRTTWIPRPSYPEIARMFGFKYHQSSIDAVRIVESEIRLGTDVGMIAERLRKPASVPPPKLRVIG